MRRLLFLVLAVTAACTGLRDSGTPTYLLPRMDSNGNTILVKTELPTLDSPYKVEGSAARVYLDPNADSNGIQGTIAEPHLAKSDNTYIPLDADSGIVLAVYAFFERVYTYEHRVLMNSRITWPRTVGVFKNVANLPNELENNALYMGAPADAYAILPYDDASRVALALNEGVLAHEHFHAHFDTAVMTKLVELKRATPEDQRLAIVCPKTSLQFELLVLRTWNEGIADFYGAMLSGRPDFMRLSLPLFKSRDLSREPTAFHSAAQMRIAIKSNSGITGTKNCSAFSPYHNGEQIGRILYHIASAEEFPLLDDETPSKPRFNKWERAARYVHWRLQSLTTRLPPSAWENIETDAVLRFLLDGVRLSSTSCGMLHSASLDMKGYPQCGWHIF